MTPERPRLIVICGPPCSGKSTLASQLQIETGLAYLSIDRILQSILPDSSFGEADRDLAYRILGLTAEHLLLAGRGVIVDATYARVPHLQDLEARAANCSVRLFLIECRIDATAAALRFRNRSGRHPAVDLNEERVKQLSQSYPYRFKGLVLDTSRNIDDCVAEIRRHSGMTDS